MHDALIFHRVFRFNEEVVGVRGTSIGSLTLEQLEWTKKAYAEETLELEDAHAVDDVVGQIDACLDLIYFAMGTLRKIGLTSEEAAESFVAVHNCNMRKKRGRVEGRDSDEDAAKPADWSGPEEAIRAIIARRSSM